MAAPKFVPLTYDDLPRTLADLQTHPEKIKVGSSLPSSVRDKHFDGQSRSGDKN